MAQNFNHFSMEEAKRLVQSEAGQKLLTLLQSQNSQQLQTAMQQAASGDIEKMKHTLGTFMASAEAQALLKELERSQYE